MSGIPLVAFRRKIIQKVEPYYVDKKCYVKPGSKLSKNVFETSLFSFMFEIVLSEEYERHIDKSGVGKNNAGHGMLERGGEREKDFGTEDGKGDATWKNREMDWYNAERRFIFSTPSQEESKKWQAAIMLHHVKFMISEGLAKNFIKRRSEVVAQDLDLI